MLTATLQDTEYSMCAITATARAIKNGTHAIVAGTQGATSSMRDESTKK